MKTIRKQSTDSAILIENKTVSSDKVLEVLGNEKQLVDGKDNETIKELKIDNIGDKIDNYSSCITDLSYTLPNYKYAKEHIEKFFASNKSQEEEHT